MKYIHIIIFSSLFATACGSDVRPSSDGLVADMSFNAELAGEVTKMRQDMSQAADDLAKTNTKSDNLAVMISALDQKKALTDETLVPEIEEHNKRQAQLLQEIGTLKAQEAGATDPTVRDSLTTQISSEEIRSDQLTVKIEELRFELDEARQSEERDAQVIVDTINKLQSTYNTTLTVLNTSRTQHVETLNHLDRTKETNTKLEEIGNSLTEVNVQLQTDLQSAQSQIGVLKGQLAELQSRYDDLKADSAQAVERLEQVNGQLGAARAEVDELQIQLTKMTGERDRALAAQRAAEKKAAAAEIARQKAVQAQRAAEQALAAERARAANAAF